jgi:hypothetical protein
MSASVCARVLTPGPERPGTKRHRADGLAQLTCTE